MKEMKANKTTATLLMVLILASMTAIAVPVHADTIEHSADWNSFTIRSQDVENRMGEVSVAISGLAVSGDLYVGNTLTLSGTVDMKADTGIHAWWIHEAWACSWGYATLTGPGVHHYEESSYKWADGYILSGWWWNIIPNDQSQTWDFSFEFTPEHTDSYTLKAFGHADAGYYREYIGSGHPSWSWSDSDNQVDSITFDVEELDATGVVEFLLSKGVLNKGQANSLLVKIEKGNERPFVNEVNALCRGHILTTALRDWLLYVEFA